MFTINRYIMAKNIRLVIFLILIIPTTYKAQIMVIKGAIVQFNAGAIVSSHGGTDVIDGSTLTNNGTFKIFKNSTLPQSGNLLLNTASTANGNGLYLIEQDWINNAFFYANNSTVELFGNTQQFITSTNSTFTTFNNLVLTGNGTGNNRKKSLLNVDAFISAGGMLSLNNRELETQVNDMFILNPAINSVTNNNTFGSEGFVSSLAPGYLYRATNSTNAYLFPVGSSAGTLRYRPLLITPKSASAEEYASRLNNFNSDNDGFFRIQNDGSFLNLNDQFYHSIEQTNGTNNVDLEFFYVNAIDGDWSSTANWTGALWENMGDVSSGISGGFSSIFKNDWPINSTISPYILSNLDAELTIPNVFTPNSDGVNDRFFINAKNIAEFNIVIVNRWGNVVFETSDITVFWDGKFKNELCTEGTYFYKVIAKAKNKKEYQNQGFISLQY